MSIAIITSMAIMPEASTSTTPHKRLRSCLSPTRFREDSSSSSTTDGTPRPSPMTSRSTSFSSSECDGWRRSKSVRWEGEGEDQACVKSYHATWSSTEYDRSPLEPPSEGERACVLPERGTRCLSPMNFLLSDGVFEEPENISETEWETPSSESIELATPLESDGESDPTEEEAEAEEDEEWERCNRRRMSYFSAMAAERGNSIGLEGYTSLSASLMELLHGINRDDRRGSSPLEGISEHIEDVEEENRPEGEDFEEEEQRRREEVEDVPDRIPIPESSPGLTCSEVGSEDESVLETPVATDLPSIVVEQAKPLREGCLEEESRSLDRQQHKI